MTKLMRVVARCSPTIALLLCCVAGSQSYAQDVSAKVRQQLQTVDAGIAQGPFSASWESLNGYRAPDWYRDAKFGIFIHWGAYSVPAFANEWYPRNMYMEGSPEFKHHVETYGPQARFGYKDFFPEFTAEKFDANAWVDLFRRAGARYIVPVAEHHDGFPMYDCSFTRWSAARMGPHRDVIGALAQAARRDGLHFGLSSHRAEHWWFFEGGMKFDSDVRDPRYRDLYGPAQPQKIDGHDNQPNQEFLDDWLARASELVDRYHPELVYFDWWIGQPAFKPYIQKFAAFYYDRAAASHRGVVLNYKEQAFPEHAATLDVERGKLDQGRPEPWQTDTSISLKSWGYIENDTFRTPVSLVQDLVDIVSKNGNFLLNVGPKPDGTIPEEARQILLSMGGWLAVNGEAIYGTRPWKTFGEGPSHAGGAFSEGKAQPYAAEDIRFTSKGSTLYAIALAWPAEGKVVIKSLGSSSPNALQKIRGIELLGSKEKLRWSQTAGALVIQTPAQKPNDFAFVFKIT